MRLTLNGLKENEREYKEKGYILPKFDIEEVVKATKENPTWIHLGAGNIFRAFPAVFCQKLIESGEMDRGITVVECYDEEIIDKAFAPFDNLTVSVSLKSDGQIEKRVVASMCEALGYSNNVKRIEEMFTKDSLQMVTLTITEKGYAVLDDSGNPLGFCKDDFKTMENPVSIVGKLAKLMHVRYLAGEKKIALVSLDNCSHNGTILCNSIMAIANSWKNENLVEEGFINYLMDESKVSYTWSMIDKITPRPSQEVIDILTEDGIEGAEVMVTSKNTYVSSVVNAEECEYLAIEDNFPNGRPALEKAGVIFAEKEVVDKIEKMKVCTCLNPLHTCLAIFGCLLSYDKISDEMSDKMLVELVKQIGYVEGLPVVEDPKVMNVNTFIDEVVNLRLPNPFIPDTPQRIACDTSKKIPVRFGETLKAYISEGKTDLSFLTFIPMVFAGYARYLTGINDKGENFEISPDPNLDTLSSILDGYKLGESFDRAQLKKLFEDESVFGVNIYEHNIGEKTEDLFFEMNNGVGAIRSTICKYIEQNGR